MTTSTIKDFLVASTAPTCTLASLATSAGWTVGRQSDITTNATNLYLDYTIGGKITVGTTPTVATVIEVWVFGAVNTTPTYPDQFGAADSGVTVTSRDILASCAVLAAAMVVPVATSNVAYWFKPVSIASLFGGAVPPAFGYFVTHNTGVNLNATAGNHVINVTGHYNTVQ